MAQVQQASTDLEALKKKPPTLKAPKLKGSPMAMAQAKREAAEQYQRDLAQYNQQIADTEARLATWNGIVGIYTSRNAELRRQQEEERRQRDAIAHDEAVARFEEEQRIKAEKQAEQERIGVHAVNPKIRERWESAPKVEGNEDALTLPDGSTISGRYILTEAGAASPSHDVNNAYAPTEGFPIDENGQSVNDRDYQRDKDAQQKVEGMAGNYDNRALQDPVIVSKDGVVLSGNNRTMSGDLAARQGTDRAYNDYLAQFGHKKYGFTPEQVASMKNPRVVFVPDEALPYDATTFARFNAQEKKSQGKPEAAVKLGKIVPDNVFTSIVNDISRYDRLSDYYADEKAIAHALGALMQAGVINDMQMPEMRTGTALSAAGKELIENTLIGKVFQTSPDAVRQIISMPTLRQSIVMGLNEIANNRTLARNGYDISEELAKAVDLVTRAKAAMPDVYTDGMPVSPFGRMQGLFDDEFGDSRVADATALLLADILNSGKPSDLRKVLTSYNNEAAQASGGQMDMFSGSIPTKEEILTTVNEHFRNATPKEQQALVDAAIAERKRRAEADAEQRERSEASEQTPNDDERSAVPQQPTADGGTELEPLAKERNDIHEDTPEEAALRARISVGDEWEEKGPAPDKPIYKRKLYVDGKHEVIQTDAPDKNGSYTGSQLTYEGRDFGDLKEIADYIDGGMQAEPTEAQKAAGNYKMEHRRVDGYNISIENAKGSVRRGTGADGKPWETTMQNDYGYIRGTEGVDGDHIDVFLSDTPEEGDVFVVDQVNEDGSFDEHKVMYGFPTEQAARDAYLSNYEPGWTGLGAITHVSKDEFKKWIQSSRRKTKPFAEYKSVKPIVGNDMIGRSLTEQEATELIARMEATAEVAPTIELTPENWIAQFGEDGTVETPIGIVKMGANQLLKLYSTKRTGYFGMIHPTLSTPDVILEEADPKEGSERDSKYLFIKTFVKSDGTRIVHLFRIDDRQKDGTWRCTINAVTLREKDKNINSRAMECSTN
ncbi:PBECR2 nuclease fold domain-containing protein [Duncaniella muris]|uniref:PBECR2 nuclease fold domain-containing protein n=1 Tax=Duncaniella muris TaxID=2094150 RepID=UPI003F6769C4